MNIEELKRLAEAATPGPWAHGVTWIEHLGGIVALGNTARSKQDVAYVASANPTAILELIRQRDELLAALTDQMADTVRNARRYLALREHGVLMGLPFKMRLVSDDELDAAADRLLEGGE